MLSLETHINSLDFAVQLGAVRDLMQIAEAKTTFWGSRVVEVAGFSGSVYLDDLVSKILMAKDQRFEADDLVPDERIAGLEIVEKLQNFYQETDMQIEVSNCLTKLLNWIREFSFTPYTPRFFLEKGDLRQIFQTYTRVKFLQEFGGGFDPKGHHPAREGYDEWGPDSQIVANEWHIRARAIRFRA